MKIGDKIIIFKPQFRELNIWSNTWLLSMNDFIGLTVTIKSINKISFTIEECKWGYSFPLYILNNQQENNLETQYEIY